MPLILIIDDNEMVRENTTETLELEGYEVVTAGTIATGTKAAQTYQPDIILCDWYLPDGTGEEVINQFPQTKIILMSGNVAQVTNHLKQKTVVGYIPKPFSIDELLMAIQQSLSES